MSEQESIDFSIYRNCDAESYLSLWDRDLNFAENIASILPKFVVLPNAKLQNVVAASYLCHNTVLCDVLPILFAIGQAGSGKSTLGILASEIFSCTPINASSSPAALRNEIMRLRFWGGDRENPYLLIWDDIKSTNLMEYPIVYSLLRSGYNRKTDQILVAGAEGTNMSFRVFGGRVVSSIEPFFNHPKMSELQRRTLPIACKRFSNFTQAEATEAGITDPSWTIEDKCDLADFDWDGLNQSYLAFWKEEERLQLYSVIKKKLSRSKHLKDELGQYFTVSKDLVATAVATGICVDLPTAVSIFAQFWHTVAAKQFSDLSATAQVCSQVIEELIHPIRSRNEALGYQQFPEVVNPKELQARLKAASQNGELDSYLTPRDLGAVMASLGWKLKLLKYPSPVTGMYWIQAIE